jgi:hypothetical protein
MRYVWPPRATSPAPEGHVLEPGQVRSERVVLEHDPGRPITGLNEYRRPFIAHPSTDSDRAVAARDCPSIRSPLSTTSK